MGVFEPEELPLFSIDSARRLNEAFKQKPTVLPLSPYPREIVIVRKEEPNLLPIVAIVGLLSFFGFLAFLAYMRKS